AFCLFIVIARSRQRVDARLRRAMATKQSRLRWSEWVASLAMTVMLPNLTRLAPAPPRRCAGAADGRAVRREAARIKEAGHDRFTAIGQSVARRIGTAGFDIAMPAAGVAGQSRTPVPNAEPATKRLGPRI